MIVAVESNFILELALEQSNAEHARRILTFAEEGRIQLLVPSCALSEPFETLTRRARTRAQLLTQLQSEITQLVRSEPFAQLSEMASGVTDVLATSISHQAASLQDSIRRICRCAIIAPLTAQVVEDAFQAQNDLSLSPQDSLIFASVESHFRQCDGQEKLFINRDRHDFFIDSIQTRLAQHNCELIPHFEAARGRLEAYLRPALQGPQSSGG